MKKQSTNNLRYQLEMYKNKRKINKSSIELKAESKLGMLKGFYFNLILIFHDKTND